MDMTKYSQSESKDLKAADFVGKNIKAVIESVSTRHYPAKDGNAEITKAVLKFVGKEKELVSSPTNTKILIGSYGKDSDDWIGHQVGLSTKEYDVGIGWIITPLDVEPPDFDDSIPF